MASFLYKKRPIYYSPSQLLKLRLGFPCIPKVCGVSNTYLFTLREVLSPESVDSSVKYSPADYAHTTALQYTGVFFLVKFTPGHVFLYVTVTCCCMFHVRYIYVYTQEKSHTDVTCVNTLPQRELL